MFELGFIIRIIRATSACAKQPEIEKKPVLAMDESFPSSSSVRKHLELRKEQRGGHCYVQTLLEQVEVEREYDKQFGTTSKGNTPLRLQVKLCCKQGAPIYTIAYTYFSFRLWRAKAWLGRASASPTVTCWLGLSSFAIYYRKRGSASYVVREVLSVREREREIQTDRERERRKWRHHCRAKIGDEFTLSLAKNSHRWRRAYTFPCQKFALFVSPFTLPVSPFTERSPWWRWYSQRVHTFHCQKNFRPLCFPSFKWHEPRDEWSKPKTNDQILPSPILFFPSKNWIKLIPKTIGNRKRDCAWGGSGW